MPSFNSEIQCNVSANSNMSNCGNRRFDAKGQLLLNGHAQLSPKITSQTTTSPNACERHVQLSTYVRIFRGIQILTKFHPKYEVKLFTRRKFSEFFPSQCRTW